MESTPYNVFMRGLTNRQPMVVSYNVTFRAKAEPALLTTNGARLMLSTPPATTREASPLLTSRAASATACMPEPQSRFTVTPETLSGNPASSSAMRATLRLSSPAWLALP